MYTAAKNLSSNSDEGGVRGKQTLACCKESMYNTSGQQT
jgi:hypothetical protein